MCPTIDTKVCNKKVAVDDSYGAHNMHQANYAYEGGNEKTGTWSCADYEDKGDRTWSRDDKKREWLGPRHHAPALSERWTSLSKRFEDARESTLRHEDGHGKCRGIVGLRWEKRDCSGDEPTTATRGDGVDPVIMRWWTDKQTNRGWPGTAEGKINTAQGMAGDLVSNLDSEEKGAVAGI